MWSSIGAVLLFSLAVCDVHCYRPSSHSHLKCPRCGPEEADFSKDFIDNWCVIKAAIPPENEEKSRQCQIERGFNLTAAYEQCGAPCLMKNKQIAYIALCCVVNYFEDEGKTLKEKKDMDKECMEEYSNYPKKA